MTANRFWWGVRMTWPLLGGALGAWLGLGDALRLPYNPDSFGSVMAMGFFGFFAMVGLIAGMASGALIGASVEWLLRHLGAGVAGAISVATLVTALALWQIVGFVQLKYPGLRIDGAAKPQRDSRPPMRSNADGRTVTVPVQPPARDACAQPPPADARARALWNTECR